MKTNYKRKMLVIGVLFLFLGASATISVSADRTWADNFDTYTNGQLLDGTPDDGGWEGWANNPSAYGTVTTEQYRSSPHSVMVDSDRVSRETDLVHQYTGYTSGIWEYTAWQYVPTDFDGETYFILLCGYDGGGSGTVWAVQIHMRSSDGLVISDFNAEQTTLIKGQWVEIKCVIDLDSDWLEIYYNGAFLAEHAWTDTIQGTGGGALNIAAVDLYANLASKVFYDDLSLLPAGDELVCGAGGPYSAEVDEDIQFHGTANGGTTPYSWHWDFGDGDNSTEQNPTHAYTEAGTFNVTLTVTDDLGAIATDTTTATITAPQPVIEIGEITGGLLKVNAVIKNTGTGDAANVNWSIALTGGIIILGKQTTGSITALPAGGNETITSKLILGLGATTITVTAGSATKTQTATVLLIFIKI